MELKVPSINLLSEKKRRYQEEKSFLKKMQTAAVIALVSYGFVLAIVIGVALLIGQQLTSLKNEIAAEENKIKPFKNKEQALLQLNKRVDLLGKQLKDRERLKAALNRLYSVVNEGIELNNVDFNDSREGMIISVSTADFWVFQGFVDSMSELVKNNGFKTVTMRDIRRGEDGVYKFQCEVTI